MGKILEFPNKDLTTEMMSDLLSEIIPLEEAVDEIIYCMLTELIKLYIKKKWSFSDLDMLVNEFRDTMTTSAPNPVTRAHVVMVNQLLKATWISIVEEIRGERV